ncbi:MAG TPA: hypothetical protein EYG66_01915 [Mariprofundaceae bacterium]|nr:hypothetical protein [Mariprofundaceae bacterium]
MPYQTFNTNHKEIGYLKKLFFARSAAFVILLSIFAWLDVYARQHTLSLTLTIGAIWLLLSAIQIISLWVPKTLPFHVLLQLCSDLILLGFIIYASGGLNSPFVFLLGVVIIIAGSLARVTFTLFFSVLASTTYLTSIYALPGAIDPENTLKILLQTSLFFLTGGIMALIARRHALLQEKETQTSSEHKQLQEIHGQVLLVMREGVITLSSQFSIQAFNPAAAELLGLTSQHTDYPIKSFITIPDSLLDFSRNGESDIFQHEISKHNLDLLLTFTKLHDDSQAAWLLTIVDITETRKLERQLGEKNKLASIGQMAALLAHEIRNPMQTISQAVELMGLQHQDPKLEHIVTDEISRLNRLLSDMLDYAHPLKPQPKLIRIPQLIQASIEHIDLMYVHQIEVTAPDIECVIDADHFRLMLDNLLRNAIRVSPQKGSIHINFSLDDTTWLLTLRDHGAGIEPSMRNTLFQPFQTGHKAGVGLGLAIVWQVCQANHWQISIDDNITDGACFIVQGSVGNDLQNAEVEYG